MTARTAVVHLVRHTNGLEPFERFVASYRRNDAGLEHDLVLIFKGFERREDRVPYLERAADWSPATVDVSDTGLDLTAYAMAAGSLSHDRICMLNSFSEILVPGWLGKLHAALKGTDAGAAGASGSWGSHLSYNLWQLGLRGPYAEVFDSRDATRRSMHEAYGADYGGAVGHWLLTLSNVVLDLPRMPPFPATHLRTNAFLIDRELFGSLDLGRPASKRATHRLESGRVGITAQLRRRGRPPVVVDRNGVVRAERDWDAGDVFWQGEQQDLLVADNQTRAYAAATAAQRATLSRYAWGPRARPG